MTKRKSTKTTEQTGSIAGLLEQSRKQKVSSDVKILFERTVALEERLRDLDTTHGHMLGAFVRVKFDMGDVVSQIMYHIKDAHFEGGWREFHRIRNLPQSPATLKRYAEGFQDISCLNWRHGRDEVLNAAFAVGLDPFKALSRIKGAKARVQEMKASEFVSFLRQKPTRKVRSKSENVADFVGAGMVALAKVFDAIGDDDAKKNECYAGIAYQIGIFSQRAAFTGGEFTVKSPLSMDALDELVDREV